MSTIIFHADTSAGAPLPQTQRALHETKSASVTTHSLLEKSLDTKTHKVTTTATTTPSFIEKPFSDPHHHPQPPSRPSKVVSQTSSSAASIRTNSGDSTYYSGPSVPPSRPSTPLSSAPGSEAARAGRDTVRFSLPDRSARASASSDRIYAGGPGGYGRGVHSEAETRESSGLRREVGVSVSVSEGRLEGLLGVEAPEKVYVRGEKKVGRELLGRPAPAAAAADEKSAGRDASSEDDEQRAEASPLATHTSTPTAAVRDAYQDPADFIHADTPTAPLAFPTTQLPLKERKADVSGTLRNRARRKILAHKHATQMFQVTLNGMAIFATWWWPRYYYILLPLITATVAINVVMIASLLVRAGYNKLSPEEKILPPTPESMVMLIPCYNETREELTRSLESLVAQQQLEGHTRAIMVICDGKVRGPGMAKSTADYLLQDILTDRAERRYVAGAYTAWDQQPMDVVVQRGRYRGVPYYCIVKQQNQGKRDGLIVVRSFLYNFNRRAEKPGTIFQPAFFEDMARFLVHDAGMDECVHLVGMDADTVFADDCIHQLLEESRYAHTVGVCGYVAVDWKDSNWNLWRLYQSAEYTIAQCLRRLHQSMVTHKVSCLPGCCQLLRICEETCGDHVLLEKFGYCPVPTDSLLKQIRATASEDRNHVCHMLSARPKAQTRQALRAKAFTDVPYSWSVFLSQRRRWTLGATSNDLLLSFAGGVQWFERILAMVNVITWVLNPFIIASLASFIFAIISKLIALRSSSRWLPGGVLITR